MRSLSAGTMDAKQFEASLGTIDAADRASLNLIVQVNVLDADDQLSLDLVTMELHHDQWPLLVLTELREDRACRQELFDPEDLASAITRFHELAAAHRQEPAAPVVTNVDTRSTPCES